MKTIRMIGMALIAVLMCVNFASCSSDDDPTEEKEENVTNGKKLVEMTETIGTTFNVTYKFSYHNDGKLSQVTEQTETWKEIYYYNWIDNQIKISSADGFTNYICTLSNGVITEIKDTDRSGNTDKNGNTSTFTYNNSKELTNYKSVDNEDSEYILYDCTGIWNNGNMTDFTDATYSDGLLTITYSNIKNKGWWYPSCYHIGMNVYMIRAAYLFLANPSLLGKPCANLPKSVDSYEHGGDYIFDIDEDGYVEMCKIVSGNSTTIYTYKWE